MSDVAERLSGAEVRSRAISGVIGLSLKTLGIRAVGLAGNVALARLLTPDDFGTVAIGYSIVGFGSYVADAGIGAALIGRATPPTRRELSAVAGLQLVATLVLVVIVALVALPLGKVAQVSAVMFASVPFMTFRTAGMLTLERDLRYGPTIRVEVQDVLVYNAWAIGTAAVGWGVWALATGTIVRAITGSALMWLLVPAGRVRPRLDIAAVRPILKFGAGVQAGAAQLLVRDYVLNFGVLALVGTGVLGIAALAGRLLQIPLLIFQSLWRVSYPAVSRLLDAGEDPRLVLERGSVMLVAGSGAVLVGLVASSPGLIPAVFGPEWSSAAEYIPGACLALLVGGPVSATVGGFLLAKGQALAILRVQIVGTLVWWALAFPLVLALGAGGLGLAWAGSSLAETILLARLARRQLGARTLQACLPTVGIAATIGGVSWLGARQLDPTILSGVLVGAGAVTTFVAVMWVVDRSVIRSLVTLARSARRARPRAPSPPTLALR